ncbi:MAG: WD40 repeat domain-containing protein, partial [Bacteroidota bacterium]
MDAASGEIQRKWLAHDPSVFCLAMHQDGRYLLSGGRDAQIKVWDIKQDFRESKRIAAHMYTVNDLAIFQGGDFFASASRDKTIKLWDAYAFDLQKVIDHERNESHTHSVNRIKCLITDNSLISCSDDRMLMRWKVEVQE